MLGFRVWDSIRKVMVNGDFRDHFMMNMDGILFDGDPSLHGELSEELTLSDERFVPMQSTGIKDREKIIIYVGDILQYDWETDGSPWHDEFLLVKDLPQGVIDIYEIIRVDAYDPKIIGNIYENPELLEQLK